MDLENGNFSNQSYALALSSNNACSPGSLDPAPFYSAFLEPRICIGIWEFVLFLIGVPANALVIYMAKTIMGRPCGLENQHLCIFSMAVADFLFTSVHCPLMFLNYSLLIDLCPHSCKFLYFITHLATVASSLSLMCLNIDKFVSLRYPLRYHALITRKRIKLMISSLWFLSSAWATFFVFGPLTAFNEKCEVYTVVPHAYAMFATVFFVLPVLFSLAISSYTLRVATVARRSEPRRPSRGSVSENRLMENDPHADCHSACHHMNTSFHEDVPSTEDPSATVHPATHRRRLVSTLKTVTFVFCTTIWTSLTFIPYRAAYLIYHFLDGDVLTKVCFALFALMVSNASGNPLITLATQYQYRAPVKKFFARRRNAILSEKENRSSKTRPKQIADFLIHFGDS